jgi:hypothetical protein
MKTLSNVWLWSMILLTCLGCNRAVPHNDTSLQLKDSQGVVPEIWPVSVPTDTKLEKLGMFPVEWHRLEFKELKLAVGIEDRTVFSPSYIQIYAYVYNKHYRGWTRFLASTINGAGHIEVSVDDATGRLDIVGLNANTILSVDLASVSDVGAYDDNR